MSTTFIFKGLTINTFCLYLFFSSFAIESTVFHLDPDNNFPIHRLYLFLTAIIFIFNMRQTFAGFLSNKSLLILLFYIGLTAFWSSNPLETIKNFMALFSMIIICIMTATAFIDNRFVVLKRLFWLFLFIALINTAVAILFPDIGVNRIDFPKPRWNGITIHPNMLGMNALVLVWLSVNLYYRVHRPKMKFLIVFAVFLAFFIIHETDSMTNLMASIVIAIYTIYANMNFSVFGRVLLFLFLFLVVLFIFALYMNPVELLNSMLEANGRNLTFTGRTILWHKSLVALSDHLFFGYGFDKLQGLTERQFKQIQNMSHLHNGYIEVLLKGGIIGFGILIFNLVKTFYFQLKIRKINKQDYVFLNTGFMMVLMHNFTESTMLKGMMTMGLFFVFIIVYTQLLYLKCQHENLDLHTRF